MNKVKVQMKASYLQLRIYLLIVLGLMGIGIVTSVILDLTMGSDRNHHVSVGNVFTLYLILAATVLPLIYFKRIINIGATRTEYFIGLLAIYSFWAAVNALFNSLWLQLEISLTYIRANNYINILEVFHWDQFGIIGMAIYQFGIYMLLLSIVNLLFSGMWHYIGWLLWAILIAAISVGTSIAFLRGYVADFFKALLFNQSLLQGFMLAIGLSILFLLAGWLLTRRRTI
ncbi:hypothetical protein GCM10023310_30670 [Paenibacillus vulneris]|uniref:ABC transporter permease n=1 Tax=Paenibacillus vulneris TaxID=1133364 RepID=A0ABW3UR22_9BACL